jgi:hypothetical protein
MIFNPLDVSLVSQNQNPLDETTAMTATEAKRQRELNKTPQAVEQERRRLGQARREQQGVLITD